MASRAFVSGFDTLRLKDAYLSFASFDSTLSGFVAAEQIEREFFRLQIPLRGELLNEVLALFMSACRPNFVNYYSTRSLKNLQPRSFNSLALTKKSRNISQQRFARNHYPETRLETIEIA